MSNSQKIHPNGKGDKLPAVQFIYCLICSNELALAVNSLPEGAEVNEDDLPAISLAFTNTYTIVPTPGGMVAVTYPVCLRHLSPKPVSKLDVGR